MTQFISERTFFGQAECSHHVSTSSLYDISSLWATGNSEVHRRPLFNFSHMRFEFYSACVCWSLADVTWTPYCAISSGGHMNSFLHHSTFSEPSWLKFGYFIALRLVSLFALRLLLFALSWPCSSSLRTVSRVSFGQEKKASYCMGSG